MTSRETSALYFLPLCCSRFEQLKPAVADRKQKLQESLQWHQFAFDADSELQWIKDYLPAAASTDYGKNLVDAQKMHKKHQVDSSCVCSFICLPIFFSWICLSHFHPLVVVYCFCIVFVNSFRIILLHKDMLKTLVHIEGH